MPRGSRQSGGELESFALPWRPAPQNRAAMEETIATAWGLLLERIGQGRAAKYHIP